MRSRILIAFLLVTSTLAALSGCRGGGQIDPPTPEPEPMLIDTTIIVPATASVNRFSIVSYSGWKATVASGTPWCHVTPADGGSGGATIAVKVDANDEFSVRQARIDIKNATTTGVINIIQQQIDVLDVTTDDICDFGPQGGTFAVNVGYNIDYTVKCSEPWVRQTQTKALQRATLMFEVDKNNSGRDRTCEVTFDGGGFNHTITVSQIAAYISLSITDVALAADVDGFPIMVESNVSYNATLPDQGWITISGDSSAGGDGQQTSTMFNLELQENEEWFLREADVVFGNPDYNLSGSVHILQKSVDIMYASLPLFSFGPEGGSFEFDIDPTKEYAFSSGNADWITVSTPADNPVRRVITVAKSLEGEKRTASLVITRGSAKKTLDFSQEGTAPEISADELLFATAGGSQPLTVTGSVEYTLVPPENAPWCVVEQSQTGEYVVTVAANDTESPRECRLVFKNEEYGVNESVTVSQAQKDAFEVSPLAFSFGPEGGRAQVGIHSNIEYDYTIDYPEWIVETRAAVDEEKVFEVALNATGAPRKGRVTFTAGGVETAVTIDQKSAYITASEHDFSLDDLPAERSFTVESNVPFYARIVGDSWLSIKGINGTEVSFALEENNDWGHRTASIIVYNDDFAAADTIKVFQGAKYYLDIAQTEFDLPPQGGTVALEVSSNQEYSYHIDGSPDWISETSALVFEIEPNTGDQAREVQIVFEQNGQSKSVSISQDAPVLAVNPSGLEFSAAGGETQLVVTSNIEFTLTPPSADWLVCESAGVASYTVRAAPNEVPEMRRCVIEISSEAFSRTVMVEVVQAAKGVFELITDSFNLGPEGGNIAVEVNTNVDYTASPSADWVTGDGLEFTVGRNASGQERNCTIMYTADGYNYYVTVIQGAAWVDVDKTQLDLPVGGGQRSFSITSNVDYEVSAPDLDWIDLIAGDDGTYNVEVPLNDGEEARECVIEVISEDYGIAKEVTVIQDRSDFFELTTTEFDFGPEGGVAEVILRTNVDYTCTIGEDWIANGGEDSFVVGKNATGQARESTIEYIAAGETYTVTVSQAAAWMTIDPETVSIAQEGGQFEISALSNVPFAVVMPQDEWISAGEGSGEDEFVFEVAEFADYGTRTCAVVFEAEDYGLSKSVQVSQKGIPDPFSINGKDFFVGPTGGQLKVTHSECSDVDLSLYGDWIRELPAMRNDTLLVFSIDTLYTDNTRQAVASVTGNGKTRMVYIFQNPPMLMLLYDSKEFPAAGGTLPIGYNANLRPNFYCDDDWVTGDVDEDGKRLLFTVLPNDTGMERSTVVEVGIRELNCIKEVTISQAPNSMIRVTPSSHTIDGNGGDFLITVEANVNYTYNCAATWLKCVPEEEEGVYRVKVQNNTSAYRRSGNIMFSGNGANTIFRVIQEGTRNPDYYYSEDFSGNGQITSLQSASVGSGIPLIVMGDAFTDRLLADGTYNAAINQTLEAFFAIEPYASFRNMFDIYKIDVVSQNEVYAEDASTALSTGFVSGTVVAGDDDAVYQLAKNIVDPLALRNTLIIVIMNTRTYGGTTYLKYYQDSGVDYGMGQAIAYIPLCTSDQQFTAVVQHEAGGHGFGKLEDEYAYKSHGEIPADKISYIRGMQDIGFYKNVDFTSDPGQVRWAAFLQDERYQYDGLGVFEGACTYYTGAYRPTETSMMYHNEGPFNAPSREAIYYRLHKLAYGNSWSYDREAFVEYDAINRRTSPRASQTGVKGSSSAGSQLPPLPRPVLEKQQ